MGLELVLGRHFQSMHTCTRTTQLVHCFGLNTSLPFLLCKQIHKGSSHDGLLLLSQSEMSCRWSCVLLLLSTSRGHTIRSPYSYPDRVIWYTMNPLGSHAEFFLLSPCQGSKNVPMISPPCCSSCVPPCLHCCATENSAITWGGTQLC